MCILKNTKKGCILRSHENAYNSKCKCMSRKNKHTHFMCMKIVFVKKVIKMSSEISIWPYELLEGRKLRSIVVKYKIEEDSLVVKKFPNIVEVDMEFLLF